MNKFIAIAFFALCATMANSQVIPGLAGIPYGTGVYGADLLSQQIGSAGGASSASASSASSSAANNALIAQNQRLVSPLSPWASYAPLASPWIGAGWPGVGPIGPLGVSGLGPLGVSPYGVGALGPIAPGLIY